MRTRAFFLTLFWFVLAAIHFFLAFAAATAKAGDCHTLGLGACQQQFVAPVYVQPFVQQQFVQPQRVVVQRQVVVQKQVVQPHRQQIVVQQVRQPRQQQVIRQRSVIRSR